MFIPTVTASLKQGMSCCNFILEQNFLYICVCQTVRVPVCLFQYPAALMNLGAILHLNGKLRDAEANYLRALQLKPDDTITQSNLRKLWNIMEKQGLRTSNPWVSSPCPPTRHLHARHGGGKKETTKENSQHALHSVYSSKRDRRDWGRIFAETPRLRHTGSPNHCWALQTPLASSFPQYYLQLVRHCVGFGLLKPSSDLFLSQ